MDPRTERRGLILAGIVGVVVFGLGVVILTGLKKVDRRETCLWNLSRVGHVVIAAEPRDAAGWDRISTGKGFFMDFQEWPGPPPFPIDPIWFCCPSVGEPRRGRIDYRGPSALLRSLSKDDPIVADLPGNHGGEGGNVCFRNGSVKSVPEADPAWVRAMATTDSR